MLPKAHHDRRHSRWHQWSMRVWSYVRRRWHFFASFSIVIVMLGSFSLYYQLTNSLEYLEWQMASVPVQLETFDDSPWLETQHFDPVNTRGVILPLYDKIAVLGISLLLELRRLQVTLPVEIPHCGDLNLTVQRQIHKHDGNVKFVDVCELAVNATITTHPVYCKNLAHCHQRFRGYNIKALAVIYSGFQEIMMFDADTILFQNPMSLWNTSKYKNTGTLFFHDRVIFKTSWLSRRVKDRKEGVDRGRITAMRLFLSQFNATPYRQLSIVDNGESRPQLLTSIYGKKLSFRPSAFLLNSHAWKLRTGHQMESALLLWNKARQPRATAVLASFISLNQISMRVPSYGDKELYWLACEIAETAYSFSDYGAGALGWDLLASGHQRDGVLCGDILQFYPMQLDVNKGLDTDVQPLYMNSDNIVQWGRTRGPYYRTAARPADFYLEPVEDIAQRRIGCTFNVTTLELTAQEVMMFRTRAQTYDAVAGWNGWHEVA